MHRAVVNPNTRQPIIQQQGRGGNPAKTQAALNAPAVRNPQSRALVGSSATRLVIRGK